MSDYSSFMNRTKSCEEQITDASVSLFGKISQMAAQFRTHMQNHNQRHIDHKAFRDMLLLDEAMLKDIGVSRSQIIWAANLPASQNASLALEKQAKINIGQMII